MLAANVCASDFLKSHEHPALYRVHEGPTADRLQRLRDFLGSFGLQISGGDSPQAKDYARLLEQLQGRADKSLLQTVMLRSLRQAQYSPDNVGHFGLAYDAYTHFTSPIRRYPDLLIHRAIKAALQRQRYQPGGAFVDGGEGVSGAWERIGLHCSMTERRADEATRDVEDWLKCYYMQDRIGEEYEGSISAVTPFGIFVALDEIFVEGLVHVSELGADYFRYDEAGHTMVGERTGRRYRLADRVRIKVMRADLETNKIDFRLVDGGQIPQRAQGKNAGVKRRVSTTTASTSLPTPMPLAQQIEPPTSIKVSPRSSTRASAASKAADVAMTTKPARRTKAGKTTPAATAGKQKKTEKTGKAVKAVRADRKPGATKIKSAPPKSRKGKKRG